MSDTAGRDTERRDADLDSGGWWGMAKTAFMAVGIMTAALAVVLVAVRFSPHVFSRVFAGTTPTSELIEFVSAVFSGLAFVGVVVALLFQHRELKLARADSKLARTLADEQRLEMARSAESLAKQNFESTFFQMLGVIRQARNDVRYTPSFPGAAQLQYEGNKAIFIMNHRLRGCIGNVPVNHVCEEYLKVYHNEFANELGQYFRVLYRTFKYIDESSVPDKTVYTGLVRAQMSNSEFFMVFYNAISSLGKEHALPLYEKYHLFDNFPAALLVNPAEHRPLVKSRFAEDSPHYRGEGVPAAAPNNAPHA